MGLGKLKCRGRWLPLGELGAGWIDAADREGLGVRLLCPGHQRSHLVCVWFDNPCDGGDPAEHPRLHHRQGDELEALTVTSLNGSSEVVIPGHWRGWIVEGRLYTSRFTEEAVAPNPKKKRLKPQ